MLLDKRKIRLDAEVDKLCPIEPKCQIKSFCNCESRRVKRRFLPENEAKINVKQGPSGVDQDVIVVPVTDSKHKCRNVRAYSTGNKSVQGIRLELTHHFVHVDQGRRSINVFNHALLPLRGDHSVCKRMNRNPIEFKTAVVMCRSVTRPNSIEISKTSQNRPVKPQIIARFVYERKVALCIKVGSR